MFSAFPSYLAYQASVQQQQQSQNNSSQPGKYWAELEIQKKKVKLA